MPLINKLFEISSKEQYPHCIHKPEDHVEKVCKSNPRSTIILCKVCGFVYIQHDLNGKYSR